MIMNIILKYNLCVPSSALGLFFFFFPTRGSVTDLIGTTFLLGPLAQGLQGEASGKTGRPETLSSERQQEERKGLSPDPRAEAAEEQGVPLHTGCAFTHTHQGLYLWPPSALPVRTQGLPGKRKATWLPGKLEQRRPRSQNYNTRHLACAPTCYCQAGKRTRRLRTVLKTCLDLSRAQDHADR